MLFRKTLSKEPPPADTANEPLPAFDDRALDTVSALMRIYGRYAVPTHEKTAEEIRDECETWAARIAIGGTRADEAGPNSGLRDWGGVQRFFEATRSAESSFVGRSQAGMRAALQQFAACLGHALATERKADSALDEQLETLTASLDSNDPEQIRKNATRVVSSAKLMMLERRQREAWQVGILAEKFNQLKSELVEARTQAMTDSLTQLYNKNALDQQLERVVDWGVLFQHPPALLVLSVDGFREIASRHGPELAETILKGVGDVLTRCFLRRQDFVAHPQAERFVVVAIETPAETLRTMADRLLDAIHRLTFTRGGERVELEVSLGIAQLTQGERAETWLERATEASHKGALVPHIRLVGGT